MRRWTQLSPVRRHSSHPWAEGMTSRTVSRCVQGGMAMASPRVRGSRLEVDASWAQPQARAARCSCASAG
ncbi:hypothetical protein [Ornithinimicrobium kibberense]|uniref:hypothetical protein n=1 Tax=Ornithinimicrobium kibberense TaxID=282060 RepID=UPI0036226D0F